jgi:phosphoribosyl 1,2-cyclic phosphodiesterase
MEISLRVLGSGSSGNAALISGGPTTLLVEAGLSCRGLEKRIAEAGRSPSDIAAVLVSHEHGDHCRSATTFAARHGIPVACTEGTWRCLTSKNGSETPDWLSLVPGESRRIGTVTVTPFRTPHDARDPIGFRFERGSAVLVHATDFGHLSREMEEAIKDASLLLIESNYDEQQLFESRYPFSTRQRIASPQGHLSNGALALYLRRQLPSSVKTVVLAHLSENTNSPELALDTARAALDAGGREEVRLLAARRHALTDEIRARRDDDSGTTPRAWVGYAAPLFRPV